jgi:hypothetical protein
MEAAVLSGIAVICTSTLAAFRRVAADFELEQGRVSWFLSPGFCDLEIVVREVQLFIHE